MPKSKPTPRKKKIETTPAVAPASTSRDYTPWDVINRTAPGDVMLRYAALALLDPGPDAFIATGPNDPRLPQPLVATVPAPPVARVATPQALPPLSPSGATPLAVAFEQLTWTLKQTCAALQVSRGFLYKLEVQGKLLPLPDGRNKRYSIAAVKEYVQRTAESVAASAQGGHKPYLRLVNKAAS